VVVLADRLGAGHTTIDLSRRKVVAVIGSGRVAVVQRAAHLERFPGELSRLNGVVEAANIGTVKFENHPGFREI